ncbi:MAG: nucleotidyltransferase family protein [Acidimicrobiales bacterium]
MIGGGTTRALTTLLRPAGPLGSLPEAAADWDRLLAIADRHRLLPALWSSLEASGALAPVPTAVRATLGDRLGPARALPAMALEDAHRANARRVADLLEQAAEVVGAIADVGVVVVPIKGVDALWSGRYPDPAARTMTDLDLLVAPGQARVAWEVVQRLGYQPAAAAPAEHHLTPLARPGRPGSVEAHTALLRGRWAGLLPAEAVVARSRPADRGPGHRLHRDDAAAILVAHAQLQDEQRLLLELPLRSLHETALALHHDEPVDWDAVGGRLAAGGAAGVLHDHLALVERLFDVGSPVVLARSARRRAAGLVALADQRRLRGALGQAAFVPRSLASDRMVALHGGAAAGPGLWATRARHVAAGVARRVTGGGSAP